MKNLFIVFALLLSVNIAEISAQSAQSSVPRKQNKTFVSVPVTVSDREGRYISDLKKEDFAVFQDNVRQEISFFAVYDEPLNIVMLLDTSGSTAESLGKIKNAAGDFIDLMNPEDKCLLATFDYQLKTLNSFTSDKANLKKTLDKIVSAERDGTILYNSLDKISKETLAGVEGRKVIVLLSDGRDFGSSLTEKQLLARLEETDVMIYTIFYDTTADSGKFLAANNTGVKEKSKKAPKPKKKKKGVYSVFIPAQSDQPNETEIELQEKKAESQGVESLKEIADLTAGRYYASTTPKLSDVFKKAAGEMRQQYRLGYQMEGLEKKEGAYNIVVKVNKSDAIVRARPSFRPKK